MVAEPELHFDFGDNRFHWDCFKIVDLIDRFATASGYVNASPLFVGKKNISSRDNEF